MSLADDIRRRLTLARYPRRSAASFTEENGHNPLVLQDCSMCRGQGKRCELDTSNGSYTLDVCSACNGSGVTGEVEPYFSDDKPEVAAEADPHGWLTCPTCGWRFAIRDSSAWTGQRHLQCGQRIRIR
jgi:hypothetical protein